MIRLVALMIAFVCIVPALAAPLPAGLDPQNTIFLEQILDDLLLSLIQPTRNGKDEKRKWIETGSHPQAYHGRLF